MKYFYFGIHKAASTWLISMLNDITQFTELKHQHYHSKKHFDFDLQKEINQRNLQFVSYTNAEYDTVKTINQQYKGFHVIRDPRDIIVSSYFSHLHSHSDFMWPEINDYRKELESLDKDAGITATIKHLENLIIDGESVKIFDCLQHWNYEDPDIIEIKFEDLTQNPYTIIPEIFSFLGLLDKVQADPNHSIKEKTLDLAKEVMKRVNKQPYTGIQLPHLLQFIYKHDFYFKSKGRKKGKSNEKSHYRKGLANDWKNHLSLSHKNEVKEKFGELLIKLGYEQDLDW